MKPDNEAWDIIIKPRENNFSLNLDEIWRYRDLVKRYIHRDIVTAYKQTILGPVWYLVQPLFMTYMYMFVFGGIANISTDGLPHMLFYMSGILCWNYFGDCLGRAQSTFTANAGVFSKIYFPRLVVPVSGVISGLLKLGVQSGLFLVVYLYYYFHKGVDIHPNMLVLVFPLLVVMIAAMGIGFGIIISSMTAKYRDLMILFGFITYLWMYATPVIYPLSAIPEKYNNYKWIIEMNPMTSVVETTRYAFMGEGSFSWISLGYTFLVTLIVLIFGIWMFNRVERSFIDVV
ncbi:MAG: ABC transporter permease [Prevotella sp.]|jgi:lipopolysaccharide transport system permease protein|nr:ABC transporter permease [Prevotella sp.]